MLKIFIKWLIVFTLKIILFIALTGLVVKINAKDHRETLSTVFIWGEKGDET